MLLPGALCLWVRQELVQAKKEATWVASRPRWVSIRVLFPVSAGEGSRALWKKCQSHGLRGQLGPCVTHQEPRWVQEYLLQHRSGLALTQLILFLKLFFKDIIYLTVSRERAQAGGAAEGEGEADSPLEQGADAGQDPRTPGS